MKNLFSTISLLAAIMLCQSTTAQTIHAIVFCNTIDESIGDNMKVDYANVSNAIQVIGKLLESNYDFELVRLDGPICTRDRLEQEISKLYVESDDVIFTFYGGHGSHAENNESDPWPQYCMNTGFENQNNWVPMATVRKWVEAKNARLNIIVSNCCNKEQAPTTIKPLWAQGGRATDLSGLNGDNYKKLFDASGTVMATSSKLGQLSWCNCYGGLFTSDFISVLEMVGKGQIAPDWETILSKVSNMCGSRNIETNDPPYRAVQNPYCKVYLNGNGNSDRGKDRNDRGKDDNDGRTPYKKNSSLADALASLTDRSVSEDARLSMINGIISKYFNSNAEVITVGKDLTTQFAEEPVRDFLKRICQIPSIKGISIIEENRDFIKVHELR